MKNAAPDTGLQEQEILRAREIAEETRRVNERLVIAGVRMQELADDAEAARSRLALIADVGRLLGGSFDVCSVLPAIVELLVHELCESCSIDVATEAGATLCSATAPETLGPQAARAVERARRLAIERGAALACPPTSNADCGDPGTVELCRACGFESVVAIPFEHRTPARVVLTLLARSRRYDPADIALAREVAERIGLAVERAELHQAALDAVRARDDLLAAVSHDLRNPLTAIVLSSAILARQSPPPEDGKTSPLQRIQRSAGHMQRLLQDLVDSVKIGAGRFVVDRQPQAIAPVVTEAIEMLAPISETKSLRVEAKIDDALAGRVVWMDQERVLRALTNLVGNAIKFTPEGGAVVVGAELSGDVVRISIRDTGPGIPPEERERIFDRFWQASRTAKLGTGLGLFIAREIVEAHDGKIWVESEVGEGSTFFVTLPASSPVP
jgi:signal transduction histidine kinase